jgi:hypothetical protein
MGFFDGKGTRNLAKGPYTNKDYRGVIWAKKGNPSFESSQYPDLDSLVPLSYTMLGALATALKSAGNEDV